MKSVYGRMLVWSAGILLLSWPGFMLVSRQLALRAFDKNHDLGMLLQTQFDAADRIYQNEGKAALAEYIRTLNNTYPGDHYYMISGSRDMLNGSDLARLRAAANTRWSLLRINGPVVFLVGSQTRDYALLVVGRSRNIVEYLPYYLLILCVVAALCWIFTQQFASPLKQIMSTVERFGSGELSARTHLARQDEFGALAGAVDKMANRIQILLAAERRLLQDISHELRSPLTRLMIAVKLLDKGDRDLARERIYKEVQRVVDLLESVLQVTRGEGDPSSCSIETLSVDSLVGELIRDCQIEARTKDCDFRFETADHVDLAGDRELLRRAIENVLRNAVRHAPAGTPVLVRLFKTATEVSITIRDYGPGVPELDLSNIFKPFFRSDESRDPATGGVGLGLAIAERAIRLHEGRIWAENAEPGLRIHIMLGLMRSAESMARSLGAPEAEMLPQRDL